MSHRPKIISLFKSGSQFAPTDTHQRPKLYSRHIFLAKLNGQTGMAKKYPLMDMGQNIFFVILCKFGHKATPCTGKQIT